jgi:hypothetical protein
MVSARETESGKEHERQGNDHEAPRTWHSNDPDVPRVQESRGPSSAWQAGMFLSCSPIRKSCTSQMLPPITETNTTITEPNFNSGTLLFQVIYIYIYTYPEATSNSVRNINETTEY